MYHGSGTKTDSWGGGSWPKVEAVVEAAARRFQRRQAASRRFYFSDSGSAPLDGHNRTMIRSVCRLGLLIIAFAAFAGGLRAQSLTVTTLAGAFNETTAYNQAGTLDGQGAAARFSYYNGVAADGLGNIYVADTGHQLLRRISATGLVTTIAGQMGVTGETDRSGTAASFAITGPIAVAPNGNIYLAERDRIRVVTPAGAVSTLAVTWSANDSFDAFNGLLALACDSAGTLYAADFARVLKISPSGLVSTLAGQMQQGSLDGPGYFAEFEEIGGLAVDAGGNIYASDTVAENIRKITPSGAVTTIAGIPAGPNFAPNGIATGAGFLDGQGTLARFSAPAGIAVDAAGEVYVADANNYALRRISPSGQVTTVAGGNWRGESGWGNGSGYAAEFSGPEFLTSDSSGSLYVGDGATIRKAVNSPLAPRIDVSPASQTVPAASTVTFQVFADGNPGLTYQWQEFSQWTLSWTPLDDGGAISGSASSVLILTNVSSTLAGAQFRCVVSSSLGSATSFGAELLVSPPIVVVPLQVTTLAGPASSNSALAPFSFAAGLKADPLLNIYVADEDNNRIRKVSPNGTVTTLAGGTAGYADGTGMAAQFNFPSAVAVDAAGNVLVADAGNGAIRRISPAGVVTTLWGKSGPGVSPLAPSLLGNPSGLALNAQGDLLISDFTRNAIFLAPLSGAMTLLAGGMREGADGVDLGSVFNSPGGLAVDSAGNIYLADTGNNVIRKINAAGVVTTAAGQVGVAGALDGLVANALFNSPKGVAVDGAGNIYVADSGNNAARKVTPDGIVMTVAGVLPDLGRGEKLGLDQWRRRSGAVLRSHRCGAGRVGECLHFRHAQ